MALRAFAPPTDKPLSPERTIALSGEITSASVASALGHIHRLQRGFCPDSILLHMKSGGGDVVPATILSEYLQRNRNAPIYGFVDSHCRSAALAILLGCERRICTPEATFFLHTPTDKDDPLSEKDLMRSVDCHVHALEMPRTDVRMLFAVGDKRPESICADRALQLGFVTEIVDEAWSP